MSLLNRPDNRAKNDPTVSSSEIGFTATLRVRHQAKYIAARIANRGDRFQRPVGITVGTDRAVRSAVSEDDLTPSIQVGKRVRVGVVAALAMSDRHPQYLAESCEASKRRLDVVDPNVGPFTPKLQALVPKEGTRQKAGFAEYLKAVADAKNQPTGFRETANLSKNWRKPGDRARAQIIAVGKTAGENHAIDVG